MLPFHKVFRKEIVLLLYTSTLYIIYCVTSIYSCHLIHVLAAEKPQPGSHLAKYVDFNKAVMISSNLSLWATSLQRNKWVIQGKSNPVRCLFHPMPAPLPSSLLGPIYVKYPWKCSIYGDLYVYYLWAASFYIKVAYLYSVSVLLYFNMFFLSYV